MLSFIFTGNFQMVSPLEPALMGPAGVQIPAPAAGQEMSDFLAGLKSQQCAPLVHAAGAGDQALTSDCELSAASGEGMAASLISFTCFRCAGWLAGNHSITETARLSGCLCMCVHVFIWSVCTCVPFSSVDATMAPR